MCRPGTELTPARASSSGGRKGFLAGLVADIRRELARSQELRDSIQRFRDEARRLEDSDALRQARRKYKSIEAETARTGEALRKKLDQVTGSVREGLDEAGRSELGRKLRAGVEEAARSARHSAEAVSQGGRRLGSTAAFRALSQGVESVRKELEHSPTGPYRRPARLRRRTELAGAAPHDSRVLPANEEALDVVVHKDSRWYQQWKDFKDNNAVLNRFFAMKTRYAESEHVLVRASRALTERVGELLGGLFSSTELSAALTEILRVDPAFDRDRFLQQCERDIIPNVLEAMISGDLDILKDWCYEATYRQLAQPIQQAQALGLQFQSRVLDVSNVDLAMGKVMEQGPVLIVTFQAQLVTVLRDPRGRLVDGDPDKVVRMLYVWALCRDLAEPNPLAAWRLLDISASSSEQIL